MIGPPMRHALTQAGYGGPYVIRGNPIGALFDQVRDFCSPVPMDQTSDNVIEDTSGQGLGTPDSASFGPTDGGGSGGFLVAPSDAAGQPVTGIMCPFGSHWNSAVGICQMDPEPMEPADPCGQDNLIAARNSLRAAVSRCDRAGIQTVLDGARSCRDTAGAKPQKMAWVNLVNEANKALGNAKRCKPMAQSMPGKAKVEAMPRVPDTRTMTEGNPDMMAHPDPMMGMIDAQRVLLDPQMAAARRAPARPVKQKRGFGVMR